MTPRPVQLHQAQARFDDCHHSPQKVTAYRPQHSTRQVSLVACFGSRHRTSCTTAGPLESAPHMGPLHIGRPSANGFRRLDLRSGSYQPKKLEGLFTGGALEGERDEDGHYLYKTDSRYKTKLRQKITSAAGGSGSRRKALPPPEASVIHSVMTLG